MLTYTITTQKEYEYYIQSTDGWTQVQGVVRTNGLLAYTTKSYLREDEKLALKECEDWIRRQ